MREGKDTTHTHTLKRRRRRRRRLQTSVSVTIDLPGTIDPSTCPARVLHSPRTVLLLLPLRSILEEKQTVRTRYRRRRRRKRPAGGARAVREYVIHTHTHTRCRVITCCKKVERRKRWREECNALHRIALPVECVVMNSKRIWKRRKKKKKKTKKLHTHKCMDEAKRQALEERRGASERARAKRSAGDK